jgi:hypothetical protein
MHSVRAHCARARLCALVHLLRCVALRCHSAVCLHSKPQCCRTFPSACAHALMHAWLNSLIAVAAAGSSAPQSQLQSQSQPKSAVANGNGNVASAAAGVPPKARQCRPTWAHGKAVQSLRRSACARGNESHAPFPRCVVHSMHAFLCAFLVHVAFTYSRCFCTLPYAFWLWPVPRGLMRLPSLRRLSTSARLIDRAAE